MSISIDNGDDDNNDKLDAAVPLFVSRAVAEVDEDDDDIDVLFLLLLTWSLKKKIDASTTVLKDILKEQIRVDARLNRQRPQAKERVSWHDFNQRITDDHFRRMFRMDRDTFDSLCQHIIDKIGANKFRSEGYLSEGGMSEAKTYAAQQHTGGYIAGEIKVAVFIRLLSGGSYLDLIPLFGVVKSHMHKVFDQVIKWIRCTFEFPLVSILRNQQWQMLHELAQSFGEKSGGPFCGTFGSLDGLAIRIASPSLREVTDPGNCYCRKGFCALNVQAICDKHKRFLWCHPTNKGSSHDSSAFGGTRLIELSKEHAELLSDQGLHLVGDSAHPLHSFLQVPCDQQEVEQDPVGANDAYNCFLSGNRIWIECAFGELVMRWGVFWRTLRFDSILKSGNVILAAMLLHNFIVENRLAKKNTDDEIYFRNFTTEQNTAAQL